ncbi:MAG TPA: alpha/beta fold hydrolase [Noviherbaspirillum sp.]
MNTTHSIDVAASAFLTPARAPMVGKEPVPAGAPDRRFASPFGAIAGWVRGSGPSVLLVHGWSGTHVDLAGFVDPLVAAGRRVISIDLPAHGQSEGKMASIPDLARAILWVAEEIGPLDGVVAHSVGCAATGVALKQGLGAPRVVLIAPPARYAHFARAFARQAGVDPEALLAALRSRDIDIDSIDFPAMAPHLKSRALIIHSKDDQVVPFANGLSIAAAWQGAVLLERDGLGHGRILADTEAIAASVSFITGQTTEIF